MQTFYEELFDLGLIYCLFFDMVVSESNIRLVNRRNSLCLHMSIVVPLVDTFLKNIRVSLQIRYGNARSAVERFGA